MTLSPFPDFSSFLQNPPLPSLLLFPVPNIPLLYPAIPYNIPYNFQNRILHCFLPKSDLNIHTAFHSFLSSEARYLSLL